MQIVVLFILAFGWGFAMIFGQFVGKFGPLANPAITIVGCAITVLFLIAKIWTYVANREWLYHFRVPVILGAFGIISTGWGLAWTCYNVSIPTPMNEGQDHLILWVVVLVTGIGLLGSTYEIAHRVRRLGECWSFTRLANLVNPQDARGGGCTPAP